MNETNFEEKLNIMKNRLTYTFLVYITIGVFSSSIAQIQIGSDIDGESANNSSGASVYMPNNQTVAIGSPSNDDVGSSSGQVRIYSWNGSSWVQKGDDIHGRASFDKAGTCVTMPNENTVGFLAPGGASSANSTGRVEVHTWNGTVWIQKGGDIVGPSGAEAFRNSIKNSISMPDENTLAVGAIGSSTWTENPNGKVFIFTWDGNNWIQKGSAIVGEASGDLAGYSVSMGDENTIAIGSHQNDANGADAGQAQIFMWDGNDWVQKGSDIHGLAAGDNFGVTLSMYGPNTVAVGSPNADAPGLYNSGQARVFTWNGTNWIQKGGAIDGKFIGEAFGFSISMGSENTVAVGARYTSESFTNSGSTRVYEWDGSEWNQVGNDVNGEAQDDESGYSISMGDASTVAIGSIRNNGNGNDAGHVRLFQFSPTSTIAENSEINDFTLYPNPVKSNVYIRSNESWEDVSIDVKNAIGQSIDIEQKIYNNIMEINLEENNSGIYFIEIKRGKSKHVLPLIKE